MFKNIFFIFLISFSCFKTINFENRILIEDQICLVVSTTRFSFQENAIEDASNSWNNKLNQEKFFIYPLCPDNSFYVSLTFVKELPESCNSYYGCTIKTIRNKSRIINAEIYIQEDASFTTLLHELKHLVGCTDQDLDYPCD